MFQATDSKRSIKQYQYPTRVIRVEPRLRRPLVGDALILAQ